MEFLPNPMVDDIVLIKRNDHNGDRIPLKYRIYISNNTYIYKARIVNICENKRYNYVQPLPLMNSVITEKKFIRKGYKTKIYKFINTINI